jgi:hypothetical protein
LDDERPDLEDDPFDAPDLEAPDFFELAPDFDEDVLAADFFAPEDFEEDVLAEDFDAPVFLDPELFDAPVFLVPELFDAPVFLVAELFDAPVFLVAELFDAPVFLEPELFDDPLLLEPELLEAPLFLEAEAFEEPLFFALDDFEEPPDDLRPDEPLLRPSTPDAALATVPTADVTVSAAVASTPLSFRLAITLSFCRRNAWD